MYEIQTHGFANFNRVIYYTCHVISPNIHGVLVVACFRQRVRLLLGELHNLILFRIADANISLQSTRLLASLRALLAKSRLGSARRGSKLDAKLPTITFVVCSVCRRLGDGHPLASLKRRKIRYQFLLIGTCRRSRIRTRSSARTSPESARGD